MYKAEVDRALRALSRTDGVVAVPTDTTYGIICRLDRLAAMERVYEIKGRDRSKPLIILGADLDSLLNWVTGDLTLPLTLADRFWPGPLTIVARASQAAPGATVGRGTSVGLRLPAHDAVRELLSRLPRACAASTSANLSGSGSPCRIEEVISSIGDRLDYCMPDCGQSPAGTESTIVDVSGDQPVIIREGALDKNLVLDCLRS